MTRQQGVSQWRSIGSLAAAAVATVVALVLVPTAIADAFAGDSGLSTHALPSAVESSFAAWVAEGGAQPPPMLATATTMWTAFHIAKAALAILLAALATQLIRACMRSLAHAKPGVLRPLMGLLAAGSAAALALAGVLVLANVQGAIAPLSSLLSMLPPTPTPAMQTAGALVSSQPHDPLAATLAGDFRIYHLAFAWAAAGTLVAIAVNAIRLMRAGRAGGAESASARRIRVTGVVASWSAAAALALLVAANASTTAQPGPALAAFLTGSA